MNIEFKEKFEQILLEAPFSIDLLIQYLLVFPNQLLPDNLNPNYYITLNQIKGLSEVDQGLFLKLKNLEPLLLLQDEQLDIHYLFTHLNSGFSKFLSLESNQKCIKRLHQAGCFKNIPDSTKNAILNDLLNLNNDFKTITNEYKTLVKNFNYKRNFEELLDCYSYSQDLLLSQFKNKKHADYLLNNVEYKTIIKDVFQCKTQDDVIELIKYHFGCRNNRDVLNQHIEHLTIYLMVLIIQKQYTWEKLFELDLYDFKSDWQLQFLKEEIENKNISPDFIYDHFNKEPIRKVFYSLYEKPTKPDYIEDIAWFKGAIYASMFDFPSLVKNNNKEESILIFKQLLKRNTNIENIDTILDFLNFDYFKRDENFIFNFDFKLWHIISKSEINTLASVLLDYTQKKEILITHQNIDLSI